MKADDVRDKFTASGKVMQSVLQMAEVFFQRHETMTFHDPLAAAFVENEKLLKLERGQVTVEPGPGPLGGLTIFKKADDGSHEIAVQVDADAFFEQYFRTVSE